MRHEAINWPYHSIQFCRGTCLVLQHPPTDLYPRIVERSVKRGEDSTGMFPFSFSFRVEAKEDMESFPFLFLAQGVVKRADLELQIGHSCSHYLCSIVHWQPVVGSSPASRLQHLLTFAILVYLYLWKPIKAFLGKQTGKISTCFLEKTYITCFLSQFLLTQLYL